MFFIASPHCRLHTACTYCATITIFFAMDMRAGHPKFLAGRSLSSITPYSQVGHLHSTLPTLRSPLRRREHSVLVSGRCQRRTAVRLCGLDSAKVLHHSGLLCLRARLLYSRLRFSRLRKGGSLLPSSSVEKNGRSSLSGCSDLPSSRQEWVPPAQNLRNGLR